MDPFKYKRLDNYILLDVNTTDLNGRIIEICMVKVKNNIEVEVFRTKVNPNYKKRKYQEPFAHLERYPTIEQIKDRIIKFMGRSNIVGWCVDFDCEHLCVELDYDIPNYFVDVFYCRRKVARECGFGSLRNVYTRLFKGHKDFREYDYGDVYDKCMATKQLYDEYKDWRLYVHKELPASIKKWEEEHKNQ